MAKKRIDDLKKCKGCKRIFLEDSCPNCDSTIWEYLKGFSEQVMLDIFNETLKRKGKGYELAY